jgi:FlaA1/EpsC-like NDP-sugar epimerase
MGTLSVDAATRNVRGVWRNTASVRELRQLFKNKWRSAIVLTAEVLAGSIAFILSVVILSQAHRTGWERSIPQFAIGMAAGAALIASLLTGLYRRSLRHANLLDARALMCAVAINAAFLAGFVYIGADARFNVPLVVFDSAILLFGWIVIHFGPRLWRAHRASRKKDAVRAVIVGAGDAGLAVLKALALDPDSPYRPVAFADDDSRKWERKLFGVPVLGGIATLSQIASQTEAEAILVCVPSATHAQMHHILSVCRRLNLPVRSLPSLSELIHDGTARLSARDLQGPRIESLLQRDEFRLDCHQIQSLVEGKTVLVTGAGGSIGSELARQIAAADPEKLLLLDKSENSLFYANLELSERLGALRVKPILTDLSSAARTRSVLKSERPDLIFHAAAHKHVSMVELHPEEAIRNNVLGTRNLAESALEYGVASLVNISTDKAVAPSNFMGLSKKLTELCLQEFAHYASANRDATRFSSVRFGNVAGSTGSVIRLFSDQIQRGGPIRVTDPRASRYFMSVSEAVHLILSAAELGQNGETFVFEMGEPFNIYELAKTMALFSGLRPHRDIAIQFTGLRKGEKLTERLWDDWEHPVPSSLDRILAIREKDPRSRGILSVIHELELCLAREDSGGLMSRICELFPTFGVGRNSTRPPSHELSPAEDVAILGPVEAA